MLAILTAIASGAEPVPVIFDTDMNGDCDDADALAVLHALADLGEARILAVVINAGDESLASGAAADVINTYYGRPDIPLGAWRPPAPFQSQRSPFAQVLRDEFPHDAPSDNVLPEATGLLRKTLAAAADHSLVYCFVGSLSNLTALLRSEPDEASPLSGSDLVRQKVRQVVVMGGGAPDSAGRAETNLRFDAGSAREAPRLCPVPMLWSQSEVGWAIVTGRELQSTPHANPVRRAYEKRLYRDRTALELGKPSHDQMSVLLAVRGADPALWDVVNRGTVEVTDNLNTIWHEAAGGPHRRVSFRGTPGRLTEIVGELMARPPGVEKKP